MELKLVSCNWCLRHTVLLIAPLMELKCLYSTVFLNSLWLLIAPLMELKFNRYFEGVRFNSF